MRIPAPAQLAITAILALLLLPASASAAVTEDFETPGLAAGTEVSTQFEANGIYFTANPGAGIPSLPRIAQDQSRSASRSLDIATDDVEFPPPRLEGRFTTVVTNFNLWVRVPTASGIDLRLEAHGLSGLPKVVTANNVTPNTWVQLTAPPADAGNSYHLFRLSTAAGQEGWEIRVDDIEFTPDPAAVPDFSLLTEDIGGVVLAGVPKQYAIDIQRLNGFADPVTLSGSATTFGETISFSPNPATGNSSTATMTLPSNAPDSSSETLTVTGSGTPGTRTLEIPFVVEQPFRVESTSASVNADRCTTAEFPLSVVRNRFFGDTIELSVAHQTGDIPSDLGVSISPASFTDPATTLNSATVRITRGDDPDDPGPVPLRVTARSGSIQRTLNFQVQRIPPRLTSVTPATLFTPQALLGGSGLTVRGNGLCNGAQIRFGNERAQTPATFSAAPAAGNPTQVQLTASTPRLATSGPIAAVNPSGAVASSEGVLPNALVNSYRNRFGFNFENEDGIRDDDDEFPIVGAGSLRDWQELLGPRQTNYNACELGAIFPGCWEVITPIPTIQHGILQTILGEAALYNRGGTCVGLAISSRRIAARQVSVLNRPADGLLAPVFSLQRSGRETIPGRRDIPLSSQRQYSPIKYAAIQHAAQMTAQYLELWATRRTVNAISGPGAMRSAIEGHLRAGRYPLLNLNYGSGGHAVNVYDIENRAGGGFVMHVYDNNWQYHPDEEAPNGVIRQFRQHDRSRIEVTPGGSWIAHGLRVVTELNDDGEVVAHEPRTGPTGDLSWIAVENELPVVPGSLVSLDGWRALATPGLNQTLEPAARAAQDAGSGLVELGYLDGEGSMLAADSDRSHTVPVAGHRGRIELGIFGEGSAAQVRVTGASASASANGGDRVILPKGGAEGIGFRATGSSARVGMTLISDGAGRMVRITGARRGTTRIRMVGKSDRIEIVHTGGAGRVRLELASFPSRGRATQFSTTLRLGRKGTVRLAPRWKRLGRRLVARAGGRRLVLRNSARPPVRVTNVGLKATRKGNRARATVRATLRGRVRRLEALVVHVRVNKGSAVAGRVTRQLGTGRRAIRRLRRGLRVGVALDRRKLRRKGGLTARAIVTAAAGKPIPAGSSGSSRVRIR